MAVPIWVWLATIGGLIALLAIDLVIVDRKPHEVSIGEAGRWVAFYIGCAVLFGVGVWLLAGGAFATEYFAGYITEYSLSIDNLFLFVIIMKTFAVPAIHQHRVLLIGIVLALIMRGIFIAVGAAIIARFTAVFFIFGAFLLYTAWGLVRNYGKDEEDNGENVAVRWLRKIVPVTEQYHGAKSFVKLDGKRWATPMLVVIVAIGSADLMFALDSIPAIFGLTQEAFLVFAANAFALMGLRQLYFLIGGLLNKLVYLSIGLSVILAFIGVKLILHALHDNALPFLNNGEPITAVPEVGIQLSLGVIVGVLAITTVASLWQSRRTAAAREQNE